MERRREEREQTVERGSIKGKKHRVVHGEISFQMLFKYCSTVVLEPHQLGLFPSGLLHVACSISYYIYLMTCSKSTVCVCVFVINTTLHLTNNNVFGVANWSKITVVCVPLRNAVDCKKKLC